MNTLITPLQVLRLAFGDGEYLPPETITEADIAAAEQRYIVPVIGRALYEKLLGGSYAGFRTGYLAAPAALFTRVAVQPRLDIRTGQCGTTAPKSAYGQPAGDTARRCWHRPGRCCAVPPNTSAPTGRSSRNTTPKKTSSTAVRPMEALFRFVSGAAAGIAALFAPIGPLVATTVVFIGVDFLSGVAADRAAALREGRAWYFESCKAWRTVLKLTLAVTAISMAWLIDSCVLDFMPLNLARLLTGFTCGVELWSFLENAAQLSDAPLFRWLRRYVRRRIRKEAGDE